MRVLDSAIFASASANMASYSALASSSSAKGGYWTPLNSFSASLCVEDETRRRRGGGVETMAWRRGDGVEVA